MEFDREADGRWIAEVCDLPGVMAYGRTRKDALGKVQAVAFAVLSTDVKRGRRDPKTLMLVQFVPPEPSLPWPPLLGSVGPPPS